MRRSSKLLPEISGLGANGDMIVLSRRGRALGVGRSEDTDMFAQILNIRRVSGLAVDAPKGKKA